MPVARAYFTQLLLGTVYAVLFLSLVPLVLAVAMLVLSYTWLSEWSMAHWKAALHEHREAIYWLMAALLGGTLGLFYHALDRIIALAKPSWQTAYQTTTLLFMLLMSYGLAILLVSALTPNYHQCDMYTRKLNGGEREYRGQQFHIELCGAGSDASRHEQIRLRIFDEHGRWRAVRYFTIRWASDFPLMLEYSSDHFSYFDARKQDDFARVMPMPPPLDDWLITHIPLLR
jgi:hypothetical protein